MSHEYYVISTHLCIRHSRYNPHPHTACENQTRSACAWTNSKSLFRVMHKPNAMQTVDSAWVDHAGLRGWSDEEWPCSWHSEVTRACILARRHR